MTGQTIRLTTDHARHTARRMIDLAPPGAVVNIREATRTGEQNAKMQAMLSDIARAKPQGRTMPTEHWKCIFMDDLDHKPNWIPSIDGDGVVNTGYRSSHLTKAEMSDMIERMYAYGVEYGVVWSEPKYSATAPTNAPVEMLRGMGND